MLPTRARDWAVSPNNRLSYTTQEDVVRRELLGVKNFWKLSDLKVIGSSNGLVGGFDGVDRWAVANDVGFSGYAWIVLNPTSLGAQIMLACGGSTVEIAFSLTGYQFVNDLPYAADEQSLSDGELDVIDRNGERLWSAGYSSDGMGFWFFLARARSIHRLVLIQRCEPTVSLPATFDPPVVGFSLDNRGLEAKNCVGKALGKGKVNDILCPLYMGGESYGGAALAADAQPGISELQGGYLVQPLSLWSETLGARGKAGNLIDVWAGTPALSDGDLLPDDGTKQMIAVGQLVLPWDGTTTPVLV